MNFLAPFILLGCFAHAQQSKPVCISKTNTYTTKVDIFASDLGYYQFEECGNEVNPTIGMKVGQNYTFIQKDISNHMHPLGFAYYPDGEFVEEDELELTISQTGSDCVNDKSCPSPLYHLNGEFLGVPGTDDIGLYEYEPKFFRNPHEWARYGEFSVVVNFNDADYKKDIFYFCHVHQYMSGRIKILDDNEIPVNSEDVPEMYYRDQVIGDFDKVCGTHGLDHFQLPNPFCPEKYICGVDTMSNPVLSLYAGCVDAMNCKMQIGMTTGASSQDEVALFIHQMIPHHENAVNMAKTLLKVETLQCEDITNEDDPDCMMEGILREIISGQNHQIQLMRDYLDIKNHPREDNCDVIIETKGVITAQARIDDPFGSDELKNYKSGVIHLPSWASGATLFGIIVPILIATFS